MVGTFNFRGAHSSKGRTSWGGTAELQDYVSFAGFFLHYLRLLQPPSSRNSIAPACVRQSSPTETPKGQSVSSGAEDTFVVFCGYSYGSLMVKHLPPTDKILELFPTGEEGTAAAEIVIRACKLSLQSNRIWENLSAGPGRLQSKKERHHNQEHRLPMTMGGEEIPPEKRRSSREIRQSMERTRSFEPPKGIRSMSLRRKKPDHSLTVIESHVSACSAPLPSTAYLLVSPLLPPISTLAAPSVGHMFWNKPKDHHECIVLRPTLSVFGDQDFFTSVKKLRPWAQKLRNERSSCFKFKEIPGAGHFWHEHGVEAKLRDTLREWLRGFSLHGNETNSGTT